MSSLRKSLKHLIYPALLALTACGADATPEVAADTVDVMPSSTPEAAPAPTLGIGLAEGFAPIAFDLANTSWLVTAIDGEPLADRYSDLATVHFTDSMLYWQACNHHEGLYVRTAASFATGPMMATLAACAESSPDRMMARIISGRPLIGGNAEEKLMLSVDGHSLTMSQIDAGYRDTPAPPLETAPYRLMVPDGGVRPPVLSFKGRRFAVWMDCPDAITGTFALREGTMRTGQLGGAQCRTHRPTATASLRSFFERNPAIARGPNGEIMLSDGDTVILGRQCNPDPSPCDYVLAPEEKTQDGG